MNKISFKKGGVNQFHGQLSALLPHIKPMLVHFGDKVEPAFNRDLQTPAYKFRTRQDENAIFDGLTFIDLLLEMINITLVTKLDGTTYNNYEAKAELSNIRSIIEDLRQKWLGKRIKLVKDSESYVREVHAAELWTATYHLVYKPTEFIEGINSIFDEFFKQK